MQTYLLLTLFSMCLAVHSSDAACGCRAEMTTCAKNLTADCRAAGFFSDTSLVYCKQDGTTVQRIGECPDGCVASRRRNDYCHVPAHNQATVEGYTLITANPDEPIMNDPQVPQGACQCSEQRGYCGSALPQTCKAAYPGTQDNHLYYCEIGGQSIKDLGQCSVRCTSYSEPHKTHHCHHDE